MSISSKITIAANNGSIGGGEVMLLNIAESLRDLDVPVSVVAPGGNGEVQELGDEAGRRGFDVVTLPAESRFEWMRQLRSWDARERRGLLWCNGLVPAVATIGHADRIVHFHQRPAGTAQNLLAKLARFRARRVLVSSKNMLEALPGATVLENWCDDVTVQPRQMSTPVIVGFLGRPSTDKGVEVLVKAMLELDVRHPGRYLLALGGTPKFVDNRAVDSVERALQKADHVVDRLGWVSRDEFFSGVDVLAVPSLAAESFGLVAAEAMAAKVPLVVSDAGALPEVVGGHGTVVPKGRPGALADAIERLAEDQPVRDSAATSLRQRWESYYSPDAGRIRVARLLEELVP
ncbi:glycosyltransferase family 4 protein [Gulosibacter molinativorax]|uniref:Glycosyl transferase family 1 n=1 Tax=Gulosibacter molinativorax TaxID=256821 RepID=A0ABT7C7T9_9MICO|nr:glycosyltransferase family 4 protein [Gulosibacter molinativorax]MDJ1371275.1 glycosyl transferase family 1 [Gulosibacter molinativorax]QUY63665.1 Putative glycosyltransferase EpsD [Gulosibacter molinativorax]